MNISVCARGKERDYEWWSDAESKSNPEIAKILDETQPGILVYRTSEGGVYSVVDSISTPEFDIRGRQIKLTLWIDGAEDDATRKILVAFARDWEGLGKKVSTCFGLQSDSERGWKFNFRRLNLLLKKAVESIELNHQHPRENALFDFGDSSFSDLEKELSTFDLPPHEGILVLLSGYPNLRGIDKSRIWRAYFKGAREEDPFELKQQERSDEGIWRQLTDFEKSPVLRKGKRFLTLMGEAASKQAERETREKEDGSDKDGKEEQKTRTD